MLLPTKNQSLRQTTGFLWRLTPCYCTALVSGIAVNYGWIKAKFECQQGRKTLKYDSDDTDMEIYKMEDITPLRLAHGFALAVCSIVPVAVFADTMLTPNGATMILGSWGLPSPSLMDLRFLRGNDAIYAASCTTYSLYIVWDMRSSGYVRTMQAVLVALILMVSGILIGPGAAFSGSLCWYEHVMSSFLTIQYSAVAKSEDLSAKDGAFETRS
jgi:hypothetical protein